MSSTPLETLAPPSIPFSGDAPASAAEARTVVELLRMRALRQPERTAYVFLADGEREEGSVTYAELDARARAVAARLAAAGAAGKRALLVHPPGLEYVAAFLGCLYAGVTAVPIYPPRPNRPSPRLLGIVADARPVAALSTAEGVEEAMRLAEKVPGLSAMKWMAAGGDAEGADEWTPPAVDGDTTAFLQYTSGSTSEPKGVMVSHGNLLHNFAVIEHFCGYTEETRSVIWLPPYHDMGLIGGILQPLYSGYPVWLMSPVAFLQRPMRWLEAVSRHRATSSGGPNFAYELCLQKATPEEVAALDLSTWELAFNGAEPVRAETLERFARVFGACGFRREAFFPCYGLAEGTLMATGSARREAPLVVRVRADALAAGRVERVAEPADAGAANGIVVGSTSADVAGPASIGRAAGAADGSAAGSASPESVSAAAAEGASMDGGAARSASPESTSAESVSPESASVAADGGSMEGGVARSASTEVAGSPSAESAGAAVEDGAAEELARTLVGCGRCAPGQVLRIVDPETRVERADGGVGEVWVMGPSVARGYWRKEAETAEAFGGRIAGTGEGPFLRTGDLGFVDGGELYVTGRIKDLVIVRGRNHYPQDLEAVAERSHPALRPGNGAAFGLEVDGDERLAIAFELRREAMGADVEEVAAAIRAAVAAEEGLEVHAVALVRPGGILKTSSGKVQRRACRAAFLSGELPLVGASISGASAAPSSDAADEAGDETPVRARLAAASAEARPALLEAHLRRRLAGVLRVDAATLDPAAALVSLGLDSLRAAELKGALEAELELSLPVTALLEDGGTAGLAAELLPAMALPDPPAAEAAAGGGPALPEGGPLSFAQEALWFLDRLHPGSAAYNVALELKLEGELDEGALRRAVSLLVRRQDALRTVFPAPGGRPAQVVLPFAEPALPLDDLSGLAAEERDAEARRRAGAEARAPFDLAAGPLVRFRLLRVDPREHRLVVVMHHAVSDGGSAGVIVRELGEAYRAYRAGAEPELAPLAFTFAEHAAREREALTDEALRPLLEHWRARLADAPPLELHPALPRPARPGTEGALHRFEVPAAVAGPLRALARREGVTPFVALLAGFAVLLARHSGEDDVVVGTPVANRGAPGAAAVVGYFVNPLPLRADLSGDPTFRALLARLRRTTLDALGAAALPFERLVEALHPSRDAGRNPVFQVMFSLQGTLLERVELPGLVLTPDLLDTGAAKLELTLQMGERAEGGWWAAFEYPVDRFAAETVAAMADGLVRLLAAAAAEPGTRVRALPLLAGDAPAALRAAGEGPAAPWADELLHAGFEAQAARTPDAAALFHGTESVTYAELDARAG
ncbi:MAG TPA: condensation domain-containing protein, partial [Longimicrobium sp.]|nr:condensation domain-containing protein [Longimicrobium sp.]